MATPRYVVGAPALLPTAKRLFVSQTLNETTTPNKGQPNANIWESAYEPIITPWMSEAAGLGGTDKDWMLISDPNDVAFMQVAFLKGQRNPTIESGEMDFSVLGMSWRCFYDFGIGLMPSIARAHKTTGGGFAFSRRRSTPRTFTGHIRSRLEIISPDGSFLFLDARPNVSQNAA